MTSIVNGESGLSVRNKLNRLLSLEVNAQTGTTYTLKLEDEHKLVTLDNPNPITLIVPAGLGSGFTVEIAQVGLGAVTVVGAGATVNAFDGVLTLPGQFSQARLSAYALNTFLLIVAGMEVAAPELVVHERTSAFEGVGSMFSLGPIDDTAITSAGIYDADDKLIRVLWDAVADHPSRNNPAAAWDGTIENGAVAVTGSYTPKVLVHNCSYIWEGVVGNTSPDHSDMDYWLAPTPFRDAEIDTKGRAWCTSEYGERLPVFGYFRTNDIQNMEYGARAGFRNAFSNCHQITSDGYYAYVAREASGGGGSFVHPIKAINRDFIFGLAGSVSIEGKNACLVFDNTATRFISGLVAQRSGASLDVVVSPGAMRNDEDDDFVASVSSVTFGSAHNVFSEEGDAIGIAPRWTAAGGFPQWVKIDLAAATPTVKYQVRAPNDLASTSAPNTWTLEGSNDNSAWTTLDTVSGQTGWSNDELRTFVMDTPGNHRYYRLHVTLANGAAVSVGELKLIDTLDIGAYFFVTRSAQNKILTVSKTTGSIVQTDTTSFTEPLKLEINHVTNDLWVANKVAGIWRITKCTVDSAGVITPTGTFVNTGVASFVSFTISPDGSTILLVDKTTHQIKAFNTSDGSSKAAFGTSGAFGVAGGYSASPDITNTKFMFWQRAIWGGGDGFVAYAPDGSFWLGDNGNYRTMHFSAGNSPTFIEQIIQMPGFYSCGVCRGDPTRVFVDYQEFAINYSLPLSPTNGSWTMVKNWSYFLGENVDNLFARLKYVSLYSNGRTYATADFSGRRVYELTSTGMRYTGKTISVQAYPDADFNLYFTNSNQTTTTPGQCVINTNPFTGFDGSDNPTWAFPTDWSGAFNNYFTSQVLPVEFPLVHTHDANNYEFARVEQLGNGVIPFIDNNGFHEQHHLGGINFVTGEETFLAQKNNPTNQGGTRNEILLYPEIPFWAFGNGVNQNAGGLFLYEPGGKDIFFNHIGEGGWGNNQVNIWHHYHESGLCVGRFGVPAPYFAAASLTSPDAWLGDNIPNSFFSFKGLSEMAGNSKWGGFGKVSDKYYLYQADEFYHAGLHRWRVEGSDDIELRTMSVISWNSGSYVPPTPDPTDMLAGLPYNNDNIPDSTAGWTRSPTTNNTTNPNGPWILALTNGIVCNTRRSPDVTLEVTIGTATNIMKTLPAVTGDWKLDAYVFLTRGIDAAGAAASDHWMAYQIWDGTGKIIFELHHFGILGEEDDGSYVNGTLLRPVELSPKWQAYCQRELPVIVESNVGAGTMQVTVGEFVVSRTVHEVGAALGAPAKAGLVYRPGTDAAMRKASGVISRMIFNP